MNTKYVFAAVWISIIASAAPRCAIAKPTRARAVTGDSPTTCVVVKDGVSTPVIALSPPFYPLAYLREKLPTLPPENARIVEALLKYPRTGVHDYWWPHKGEGGSYDGATTDILLNGARVMRGEPKGRTFCCGLTLEVLYGVMPSKLPDDAKLTTATAAEFKNLWFCRNFLSPGPEDALVSFGMGKKIEPDDALPGDFVQLWRNDKSGHSVIFVAWAKDREGKTVGIHYWSTQTATKGIAFAAEAFGTKSKTMDRAHVTFTRLLPESQWRQP
jgi:hypothetical protein